MKKADVALSIIALVLLGWFLVKPNITFQKNTIPKHNSIVTEEGTTHFIVLTDEGYIPKESSITVGDTIVFSNETGKPFWPASNLHPSHRDYPEFDPREPILPDETWSFTFTHAGEWKFHDHLAPYFTGVIIVSE